MKTIATATICLMFLSTPFLAAAQEGGDLPDSPIRNPFLPQLPEKPVIEDTLTHTAQQPSGQGQTTTRRDPDQPRQNPKSTPGQTDVGTTPPAPPPPPKPNFRVTGILWNSPRPQAIINGQVIDIGDVVDGYRIESIHPAGIEVSIRGVTMTVEP